jgi:hypothetical protein
MSLDNTRPKIDNPPPKEIDPADWAATPPAVQRFVQDQRKQRRTFQKRIADLERQQKSAIIIGALGATAIIIAAIIQTFGPLIAQNNSNPPAVTQIGSVATPVPSTSVAGSTTPALTNTPSPSVLVDTPSPQPTAPLIQVQATITALANTVAQVYGPVDGELEHGEDGLYHAEGANIQLRNFIVEARFHNPYDRSEGGWDYGFLFRNTGANEQYRLYVDSDGTWGFRLRNNDDEKILATTPLQHLKTGATDTNLLRLIVKDNEAFFFVNDNYISTLDVSEKTISGLVLVVEGLSPDHEISGKVTRYDDLTIWRLP